MEWFLRRLFGFWVRTSLRPEDVAGRLREQGERICYVLERHSASDLAVLANAVGRHDLPATERKLTTGRGADRSVFDVGRRRGFWDAAPQLRPPRELLALVRAARADASFDVLLVPTSVYWGRAPQKEGSWFRLLFAETWTLTSRLRKFLAVLINGRDTMLEFGEPISLRSLLEEEPVAAQARRVTRVLRGVLRRQRATRIGPDMSHRRTILARVLRARAVRQVAAQEAREKKIPRRQALLRARGYGEEIAANYSHSFVRFLALVFTRIWNRVYDGVIFAHAESLPSVAQGNEIVYVPCHRSHMDYLLLSYAIYNQGYAIPHIAAGINLNIPVIGRLLRKGGAFFIRRSFAGNALYTVVFMKYLAAIMARGHSIEYFIEGGRSRTGRLLQPKTGMLTMTVRSYLRDPVRPVVFMPVYFGYERIVEAATYVSELSGKPKQKEGFLDFLRALRVLRERFGEVHVNVGEPLHLDALLDQHMPDWRSRTFDDDTRHPGINAVVNDLATSIMQRINAAAAVNPINLLSLCLLATQRSALVEKDLLRQLQLYLGYLATAPYGERVTVTRLGPAEILAYAESLGIVTRDPHKLGDVIRMTDANAVLSTYYRNNVLHLFAMPSLIACAFIANAEMRTEDIQRLAWRIYPYVASELFLKWSESELPRVVIQTLAVLRERGVLECNPEQTVWRRPPPASPGAMQLSLLAQLTLQFIERYYLAIALLIDAGSGQITQRALAERCQLMAQRMTLLYGFNSPEFFDRALFENFIDLLRERRALRVGEGGKLHFDEVLAQVARDAQIVLSEQIRHSILQVTHD